MKSTKINFNQVQNEYNMAIKKKENELINQTKSQIKDTMRITLKELGQIHYKYGFLPDANV